MRRRFRPGWRFFGGGFTGGAFLAGKITGLVAGRRRSTGAHPRGRRRRWPRVSRSFRLGRPRRPAPPRSTRAPGRRPPGDSRPARTRRAVVGRSSVDGVGARGTRGGRRRPREGARREIRPSRRFPRAREALVVRSMWRSFVLSRIWVLRAGDARELHPQTDARVCGFLYGRFEPSDKPRTRAEIA